MRYSASQQAGSFLTKTDSRHDGAHAYSRKKRVEAFNEEIACKHDCRAGNYGCKHITGAYRFFDKKDAHQRNEQNGVPEGHGHEAEIKDYAACFSCRDKGC